MEELHGKSHLAVACNTLQRLRHALREKDIATATRLLGEVKAALTAIAQLPIELLTAFVYFSVRCTHTDTLHTNILHTLLTTL